MKVVFSDEAKADLIKIGDYIAKDSPRSALEFIETLEEKAIQIGDMPNAFPLFPRYGVRRRSVGNYLIFYRIEDDRVSIIHILHGAMDYAAGIIDQ
jgi:addiction module RelE/StbE family toxin